MVGALPEFRIEPAEEPARIVVPQGPEVICQLVKALQLVRNRGDHDKSPNLHSHSFDDTPGNAEGECTRPPMLWKYRTQPARALDTHRRAHRPFSVFEVASREVGGFSMSAYYLGIDL